MVYFQFPQIAKTSATSNSSIVKTATGSYSPWNESYAAKAAQVRGHPQITSQNFTIFLPPPPPLKLIYS